MRLMVPIENFYFLVGAAVIFGLSCWLEIRECKRTIAEQDLIIQVLSEGKP